MGYSTVSLLGMRSLRAFHHFERVSKMPLKYPWSSSLSQLIGSSSCIWIPELPKLQFTDEAAVDTLVFDAASDPCAIELEMAFEGKGGRPNLIRCQPRQMGAARIMLYPASRQAVPAPESDFGSRSERRQSL